MRLAVLLRWVEAIAEAPGIAGLLCSCALPPSLDLPSSSTAQAGVFPKAPRNLNSLILSSAFHLGGLTRYGDGLDGPCDGIMSAGNT